MNKRLKEILKEYEERKHKIIKGDESMNIVVLAGGTSTEREILHRNRNRCLQGTYVKKP